MALALEGLLFVPVSIRSVERTSLCQPELNELHAAAESDVVQHLSAQQLTVAVNSLHTAAGGKGRNVTS